MRTLKYAILGLLNMKDMSGYDLSEEFGFSLNEFWHASHSQIYPELKKLTAEGMIEYEEDSKGEGLVKKIYHITDLGRKDFINWLSKDEEIGETPKDVFRLRMFFSSRLPGERRLELLKNHLMRHELRISHLKNNMTKFSKVPQKDSDEFGDYLVLMGAIMREEMTIEWIKKCIELCNR